MRKEILLKQGRGKQIEAGKLFGEKHPQEVLSTIDKGSEHNTQKEIAEELGWSTGRGAPVRSPLCRDPDHELTRRLREVIEVKFPQGGDRKSSSVNGYLNLPDAGIDKHASSDAKIIKEEEELAENVESGLRNPDLGWSTSRRSNKK